MKRKLPSKFKIAVSSKEEAMEVLEAFEAYGFMWLGGTPATEWYPSFDVVGLHVDNRIITYSDIREFFNSCSEPQLQLCNLIRHNTSVAVDSDTLSMFDLR